MQKKVIEIMKLTPDDKKRESKTRKI